MTPERWRRIETLVRAGLELEDTARRRFLDEACAGDDDLRREVESLLAAHQEAGSFLEAAVEDEARQLFHGLAAGRRIGVYRIVEELGRGGMSTVYLARRDDGVYSDEVALKVIRSPGAEMERRFRQERQILARLDHPGIARLCDGGVTPDGLPYLVMEKIDGEPIDQYCRERGLPVRTWLELFLEVLAAVDYAHRNLVVHRDLKPSNILVSDGDGRDGPRVKLLDFGIAKLLEPEDFPLTAVATATAVRAMTPEYASPEQVRGEPVTTASDVYSLGVLLYELLAGRRPYDLASRRPSEVERVICEVEPPWPANAAPGENRISTRGRRLAGDLDDVVLMALRKGPAERYPSAAALAEDLRRYLDGRPVLARRGTWRYRAGKFVRRHRAAVTSAALVFLALFLGLAATLWQARLAHLERQRAEHERDAAEEVADFLQDLFEVSDPAAARGTTLTARELLDGGAARIADLESQPQLQARLMATIGGIYRKLGLFAEAEELLVAALEIRRRELDGAAPELAGSLDDLANVLYERGDLDAAESLYREALAWRREAPNTADLADTLDNLAALLHRRGDLDAAEPLYREALEIRRRLLDGADPAIALSLNNLGGVERGRGDLELAGALFNEALRIRRAGLGEDHPAVAESLNNVASVLYARGDLAAAEPLFRDVLERRRLLFGDDHPATARSLSSLARVLLELGRPDEAEPLYRDALALKRRQLDAGHPSLALTLDGLAATRAALGDAAAAAELYGEALAIRRAHYGAEHPRTRETESRLLELRQGRGVRDSSSR